MSRRKCRGDMLAVYDVDTVVQTPDVTSQSLQMLLPHEWFSALYHKDKDLFHAIMGTDTCKEFWTRMAACDEPWLKHHEYRQEVEADPARRVPLRIFGDAAAMGKQRGLTVLHFCAMGCRLPSLKSRLPIYIIPCHWLLPCTLEPLNEVVAWSFRCLADGTHPLVDHLGKPWPQNSERRRRGGTQLADGWRGIFVAYLGDWEWQMKDLHVPQHYKLGDICVRCCATKRGRHNYANFNNDPPLRSEEEFRADLSVKTCALLSVPGSHHTSILGELMHAGPLGVCPLAAGAVLVELCEENVWPLPAGITSRWEERLALQLGLAYSEFRNWCKKERVRATQRKFTPARLNMSSLTSWPCLKAKAANCLKVQSWLAHKCAKHNHGEHGETRALTMWGFDAFFTLCRKAGEWLSVDELARVDRSCRAFLFGYHALSAEAHAFSRTRWEMRPKHHVLRHVWKDTLRTARNPAWQWTFVDEDSMMKYVKVAAKSHPSTIPRSALERWVMRVWVERV